MKIARMVISMSFIFASSINASERPLIETREFCRAFNSANQSAIIAEIESYLKKFINDEKHLSLNDSKLRELFDDFVADDPLVSSVKCVFGYPSYIRAELNLPARGMSWYDAIVGLAEDGGLVFDSIEFARREL